MTNTFIYYFQLTKPKIMLLVIVTGAMASVGAWDAATGETSITPWLLFLIIFLWTPPHFWALALFFKNDNKKAGLPMMPVVKGETKTLRQIIVYSFILVAFTLVLFFDTAGWMYLLIASILGALFIKKAIAALRHQSEKYFKRLFAFSIVYLFSLFLAIVTDNFFQNAGVKG